MRDDDGRSGAGPPSCAPSRTDIAQEVLHLNAQATPGPWLTLGNAFWTAGIRGYCYMTPSRADAALIAYYRTTAPALAREVLRLRADLRDLRGRVRADVAYEMQKFWLKRESRVLRRWELDSLGDCIVRSILDEDEDATDEQP